MAIFNLKVKRERCKIETLDERRGKLKHSVIILNGAS